MLGIGGMRLLRRPPLPPQEVRLRGRRHSKARDSAAISHHYDVSNKFYEWLLGPSMAYTCAVYPSANATLEEAQFAKHDLVARKIGLRPGMRLLDVGCGWGGMVRHAAEHYGVQVLGVTLSREQALWGQERVKAEGLDHLAEIRHLDYRDVREREFDAVSSIGLIEHIGVKNYPAYFHFLRARLRPKQRGHEQYGDALDPHLCLPGYYYRTNRKSLRTRERSVGINQTEWRSVSASSSFSREDV